MNKLHLLKIALLIVILAEEIKRAKEFEYIYFDSNGKSNSGINITDPSQKYSR